MWDAGKIEVAALLKRNGKRVGVLPMQYAGTPNQFTGTWSIKEAGLYETIVYAYDASKGNTGLDRATFRVK
jgi:hypothetical protein